MLKNIRLKFWEAKAVSWDGVLYRIIMRLLHKYNCHYMPPSPIIDHGKIRLWCQWCGLRQTIKKRNWVDVFKEINNG